MKMLPTECQNEFNSQKPAVDKRSSEEIYQSIIAKIKLMYQNQITEQQAEEAARNLIGFCQQILNYQLKKQQAEQKQQTQLTAAKPDYIIQL